MSLPLRDLLADLGLIAFAVLIGVGLGAGRFEPVSTVLFSGSLLALCGLRRFAFRQ